MFVVSGRKIFLNDQILRIEMCCIIFFSSFECFLFLSVPVYHFRSEVTK